MPFLLLEVEYCGGIGVLVYMSFWLPSRNSSSSSFDGNLLPCPSLVSSFLVLKLKLASPLFFIPTSWIQCQVNFLLNHYPSKITSQSLYRSVLFCFCDHNLSFVCLFLYFTLYFETGFYLKAFSVKI